MAFFERATESAISPRRRVSPSAIVVVGMTPVRVNKLTLASDIRSGGPSDGYDVDENEYVWSERGKSPKARYYMRKRGERGLRAL